MKLKYMKVRFPISILLAACGVCLFIGASRSTDRGAGYVALTIFWGIVFIAFGIVAFAIPTILDKKKFESIIKVQIVDASGKTSTGSAVARGAVGSLVAGPAGALVGASTAKHDRKTTFLITYKDGKKKKLVLPNDSPDYNRYVKMIE